MRRWLEGNGVVAGAGFAGGLGGHCVEPGRRARRHEQWTGNDAFASDFDVHGALPKVAENVTLIPGWIEDTLPGFLDKHNESIAFIHIDTDTYTPAKFILSACKDRLQPGSVILFDEYFGYPNWRNHEHKALSEELIDYKFIVFGRYQAGIVITSSIQ